MILVVGYGNITKGIIHNLVHKGDKKVTLLSKHKQKLPEVTIIDNLNKVNFNLYKVVIVCFETEDKHKKFFSIIAQKRIEQKTIIIDLSTIKSQTVIYTKKFLPKNILYIESPITGSKQRSWEETLSAFVYKDMCNKYWKYAESIIALFAKNIYIFNKLGSPMKFKLFYNA